MAAKGASDEELVAFLCQLDSDRWSSETARNYVQTCVRQNSVVSDKGGSMVCTDTDSDLKNEPSGSMEPQLKGTRPKSSTTPISQELKPTGENEDMLLRNKITLGLQLARLERQNVCYEFRLNRQYSASNSVGPAGPLQCLEYYERMEELEEIQKEIEASEKDPRGAAPIEKITLRFRYNKCLVEKGRLQEALAQARARFEADAIIRKQVTTYCVANTYDEHRLPVLYPYTVGFTLKNYMHALIPKGSARPRFLLMRVLGSGGFSTVYKALDLGTLAIVAIKVSRLGEDASKTRRWRYMVREAEIHRRLHHPYIVQTYGEPLYINSHTQRTLPTCDSSCNEIAISMELCDGRDLFDFLALNSPLRQSQTRVQETEILLILLHVAEALRYLHSQEPPVTHNDVTFRNILSTNKGTTWKLGDFTLAKQLQSNEPENITALAGTPYYIPPEKLGGEGIMGPASDMYSLGIIAFGCYSGSVEIFIQQTPGQDVAQAAARFFDDHDCAICTPSPEVREMIVRLLSRNMDARPSATAFCEFLQKRLESVHRTAKNGRR
ncbi:Kinase, CAMK CAMK-Unique [Giardia muris]|uniref:non-specific serine/threonine protein kinase n=1 Tax=Giardia muris TaxID=5742 RepID=A0A4Z1SW68_GIAMU|nr:Kinase, CAMK CAMK-Unique [Giardia muris]|eukprot:TNJ29125.1 Kinase, CAMK CAMK-Unique [Giardia muris]